MNSYLAGDLVQVQSIFTNLAGTPVVPSTITLKYAITVNGIQGSTTTISGGFTNPSTGIYQWNIDTTSNPGYYLYEYIGTGTGQAVGTGSFLVDPLPL